jgi:hypothetical protein
VTLPGGGQPALDGLRFRVQFFEFERQTVADAALQAAHVVPALQKPEEATGALLMSGEMLAREQFRFECAEERLVHRVVVDIAGGVHRRLHARDRDSAVQRQWRCIDRPYQSAG